MGKAIFYCVECSRRVTESEIDAGKAFRFGDRILCRDCAPESIKTGSTKKVQVPSRQRPATPPALKPVAPSPAAWPYKQPILLGLGGACVLLLICLVALTFRPSAPIVVPPPPDPAPVAAADPAVGREASAEADLNKARVYGKAHPEDLIGRAKEFDEIRWKWGGTRAAEEAGKEHAALKALVAEQVAAGMAELNEKTAELEKKEDYRSAIQIVEKAKGNRDYPEWKLAVEKRASELYAKLNAQRDKAAKAPEEPPKPDAPKAPSEELKSWGPLWEAAAAKATARDYAASIAELEPAAAKLKDEAARKEAGDDVADLKAAAAAARAGLEALRSRPQGGILALDYRDDQHILRAAGTVLQIDPQRVQLLGGKGLVLVDWADVTAETLGRHAGKAEPRALALLCALEGELDAARSLQAELPARWIAYAAGARARIPKPDPAERNARQLYTTAENAWRSMETRPTAVDAYRALKTDFSSSALVKANAERIARRSEGGKEYFFAPADFRIEGTFKLAKSGKLESVKDSDEPDTLRNQAEIEFSALPGLSYRCWLWTGACCEETFLFYLQGTEFQDTDAKTKKKISCEPGGSAASPVRHSIRGLKKTHALHSPKKEPKSAARWEWIEIPLPKYAGPGAKKLRFLTNQAGFSIGAAMVSSSRKAAPAEAELKDLEAFRPQDDPTLPVDPDLIGWWPMDDGAGSDVADLSGKGHAGKLSGDGKWVEGKLGGALKLAGGTSGVVIPDAEELRLPGNMTAALWIRKDEEVGDWVCLIGKGKGQQRNFAVWMEARTKQVLFQQYGPSALGLKTDLGIDPGAWRHVACVVDGRRATVYVDGVKAAETERKGDAEVPPHPLGIGWACEHAGFVGAVDDVRLYRRALSAEEIQNLYANSR